LELVEKVREKKLVDCMTAMGAKLAGLPTTFSADQAGQKSSYDDECAASLFSVHQDSKKPGWTLVKRGTPSVEPREMVRARAGDAVAREHEDLVVERLVMLENPGDYGHDGTVLGKQKAADGGAASFVEADCCRSSKKSKPGVLEQFFGNVQGLEAKNAALEAETLDMQTRNKALEEKNKALEAGALELQTRIKELETETLDLQTKNKELETGALDLQTRNKALEEKNQALETGALDLRTRNKALEMKNQALETGALNLRTKNKELEARTQTLETGTLELQSRNGELDAVKAQKVELHKRIRELETKMQSQHVQEVELRTKIRAMEMKERETTSMNEMRAAANRAAESSLYAAEEAVAEAKRLQAQCAALNMPARGCLPDIGMIMLKDASYASQAWLVRYGIVPDAVPVTEEALKQAFAEHRVVGCQIAEICGIGYVLLRLAKKCTLVNLLGIFCRRFGSNSQVETLDPASFDKMTGFSQTHTAWVKGMFNPFIEKLVRISDQTVNASGWPVGPGIF